MNATEKTYRQFSSLRNARRAPDVFSRHIATDGLGQDLSVHDESGKLTRVIPIASDESRLNAMCCQSDDRISDEELIELAEQAIAMTTPLSDADKRRIANGDLVIPNLVTCAWPEALKIWLDLARKHGVHRVRLNDAGWWYCGDGVV